MSLKLKKEMNHHPILDVLIDDDSRLDIKVGKSCKEHKERSLWGHGLFHFLLNKI
jgi:hypothetical protein